MKIKMKPILNLLNFYQKVIKKQSHQEIIQVKDKQNMLTMKYIMVNILMEYN